MTDVKATTPPCTPQESWWSSDASTISSGTSIAASRAKKMMIHSTPRFIR
jgi:hypothetical protein